MGNLTIWKFNLPVRDEVTLSGPRPLNIVHVEPNGPSDLTIWAEVDPGSPTTERYLYVVGTGNPVPNEVGQHVASVVAPPFVWHVYEGPPTPESEYVGDPDDFEEGCPDCGQDTVVLDDIGEKCANCGWRD